MLIRIALLVVMGIFTASQVFASVTDEVKKTVDEVVKIVSSKQTKNESARRQALREVIGSIFDYTEMSKRSLGRYWNQRTPQEKEEFAKLFSALLEKTYANKIESYHNEKIVYTREITDGGYSEVKSTVITPSREEYSLDYKLMNENGAWKVYDVVIEGVSLISNYRGQFSRIISEHGYGELVKKLQAK